MKNFKSVLQSTSVFCLLSLTAACNTVPSSSSSSSSGSPPPASSSSGSSSSSSSSGGGRTSSSSQGTGAGQSSSQQGSQPASQSASQAGAESQQAQNTGSRSGESQSNKSDDEILADALGEFEKRPGSGQQTAETGRGAATAQSAATNSGASATAAETGNGQRAMTDEEKARILDAQLKGKFAKFDDLMLGERDKISRSANESGSGGGAYGGNGEGDEYDEDPLQTAMANQQPLPPRGGGFPGDKVRDDISPAPGDVGDGQDDDIIARQLREAAQKEKDPELRAKLWDEYRKYKKGA